MRVIIGTKLWVYRLDRRDPERCERVRHWLAQTT